MARRLTPAPLPIVWLCEYKPYFVYECWQGDELVYIGSTTNPQSRLETLHYNEWWTPETQMAIVEAFLDKWPALRHEGARIREKRPKHNVQYNPERRKNRPLRPGELEVSA
jgi:predicted GIY-YIG superfamily endonuclease